MPIPKSILAATTLVMMLCLLTGCGRKGPLFMGTAPVKAAPEATVILNPVVQSQPETKK